MLTLSTAGLRIQRELTQLEETLNTALAQAAALTATCALTRNLPEVSRTTGQPAMLRLVSLAQHLTQGASDVARVHAELLSINQDLEVMMPDQDGKCPPLTTGQTHTVAA